MKTTKFRSEFEPLIVTGSQDFARYVIQRCGLPETTRVLKRVTVEDVKGRHVFGILPPSIARHAALVSTIEVEAPPWMKPGKLSIEEWQTYGRNICTYWVEMQSVVSADGEIVELMAQEEE